MSQQRRFICDWPECDEPAAFRLFVQRLESDAMPYRWAVPHSQRPWPCFDLCDEHRSRLSWTIDVSGQTVVHYHSEAVTA